MMLRTVFRAATVATVTAVLTVAVTDPALAAGEEISTTLDRITGWIQGILLSVGILTFVLGAGFYLAEGTIGGQEKGKALMVGAVIGVILGFLARPIVNLAASFVR
jgi:type IV secretory pathway VirB2 component (pilin)